MRYERFSLFTRRDPMLITPLPYYDMRRPEDRCEDHAEKIRLARHSYNAAKARKDKWAESKLPSNVSLLRRQGN